MEFPGAFYGIVCLHGGDGDLKSASDVGAPGACGGGFAANVWGVESATDGFFDRIGIRFSAAGLCITDGGLRDAKGELGGARLEQL